MSFLPIINSSDINAIKNLSRSERETLIKQINSADPHYIFQEAGESRNPAKRKIIATEENLNIKKMCSEENSGIMSL